MTQNEEVRCNHSYQANKLTRLIETRCSQNLTRSDRNGTSKTHLFHTVLSSVSVDVSALVYTSPTTRCSSLFPGAFPILYLQIQAFTDVLTTATANLLIFRILWAFDVLPVAPDAKLPDPDKIESGIVVRPADLEYRLVSRFDGAEAVILAEAGKAEVELAAYD